MSASSAHDVFDGLYEKRNKCLFFSLGTHSKVANTYTASVGETMVGYKCARRNFSSSVANPITILCVYELLSIHKHLLCNKSPKNLKKFTFARETQESSRRRRRDTEGDA